MHDDSPCLNRYPRLTWQQQQKSVQQFVQNRFNASRKTPVCRGVSRLCVCVLPIYAAVETVKRQRTKRAKKNCNVPFFAWSQPLSTPTQKKAQVGKKSDTFKMSERGARSRSEPDRLSRKYRRRQQQWPQLLMILPLTLKK